MEKHVYPSDEEETNFWSQSMKGVIRQDRCKRTKKQNETFKQNAFLRIHTYYWAPRRGSFESVARLGSLETSLFICQKTLPGVCPGPSTWAQRISNLARYSPSLFYHPLCLGLSRALVVPLPAWGPEGGWVCGSPWSCCQLSHLPLSARAAPLAQLWPGQLPLPAASSLLTSLLPLHPTWLMIIALLFPLVNPNCMSFPQLNSNQYSFCVSQCSPGERTNTWRAII